MLHDLFDAQAQDPFCLSKFFELDRVTTKRHFAGNYKGLLIKLSPLDDAEQIVTPLCPENHIICVAHVPRLAAHPGGTFMYASVSKLFLSSNGQSCLSVYSKLSIVRQESSEKESPEKNSNLLTASKRLEFIYLDILDPLPVTKS
jgi:hypothetical protein